MLEKPMVAKTSTNGPTIYRRKIPFQPFETFPERVRAEALASATADKANPKKRAVKRSRQHEGDEGRKVKRRS
ncbi:hypothetical protein N7532_010000 [Penicillium argentinense]|uniref:Uncharacterized protein n=1 Tax=Penicillium argentinense TaxID=1131581 RepID=A0A9W9JX80_9EURO|nr:uncharacterized protein N7532_010000 [Penicillium argentinense]KAJ5085229.1 hypothetical protein N7532_010000 [Penicillium argentinense]